MIDTKPRNILLVNHSPEEKSIIRSYLSSTSSGYEFVEADDQSQALEFIRMAQFDCIILNALPDNTELLQALSKTPIVVRADSGAITTVLEALQPKFTERRQNEFTAQLAHDLRNPLNSILGYTRLLRLLKNLPEQALQFLEIIERNGKIQQELINNLLGNQTTISRPLPAQITSAFVEESVEDELATNHLLGIKLLVIEDDVDSRELIQTVLTNMGAIVTLAASGKEAITYLMSLSIDNTFDLLISDISLPDEDGYSLIRKVRKLPNCDSTQLPAIALTAFSQVEDRIRCLRAGFQTHISKPLDPLDLSTVIQALLTSKE